MTYNYNGSGAANTTATATYTFKNWNLNTAGTSTSYSNAQTVKNLTTTNGATVNLYAQWNTGSVTLPTPTRENYIFDGWYTAATGGTKVGNGGSRYTPTTATTLYAHWAPVIARIGTVDYRTLLDAVEAVGNSNTTITMVNSTEESITFPEGKSIILNLNGKTVTGNQINQGTLTITGNGTLDATSGVTLKNEGTLNFESGTIKTPREYSAEKQARAMLNLGTTTMSGGTAISNYNRWVVENQGIFNLKEGIINLNYEGNATALYNTSGIINMSGGTVTSMGYALVIDSGEAHTTSGNIIASTSTGYAVVVRNTGRGYFKNTTIQAKTFAIINQTENLNNCQIRSRATNYGITGGINGRMVATTNTSAGQAQETITVYHVSDANMLFPTWTVKNGQDDLQWYRSEVSNAKHSITIYKSKHNNETGTYNVHMYTADSSWAAKSNIGQIILEF